LIGQQMGLAQRAMGQEKWKEAARLLDGVLEEQADFVPALFFRSVCHMRLSEWDEAEAMAESTLGKCGSGDKAIREQLTQMLEQLPMARNAVALKPVTAALEKEDWAGAIRAADKYLAAESPSATVLFYKALAQFRLKKARDAHQTAREGLNCATSSTPKEIRRQLEQILEASDLPPWAEALQAAVEAMNKERWTDAIEKLDEVLRSNDNAQAYFYRALAKFRAAMDEIKSSGGVSSFMVSYHVDKIAKAWEDIEEANRYVSSSDKELKKAISTLQQNIKQALSQLGKLAR
jgi:tetratricopeptide (TPR) repeat protein